VAANLETVVSAVPSPPSAPDPRSQAQRRSTRATVEDPARGRFARSPTPWTRLRRRTLRVPTRSCARTCTPVACPRWGGVS